MPNDTLLEYRGGGVSGDGIPPAEDGIAEASSAILAYTEMYSNPITMLVIIYQSKNIRGWSVSILTIHKSHLEALHYKLKRPVDEGNSASVIYHQLFVSSTLTIVAPVRAQEHPFIIPRAQPLQKPN